MRTKIEMELSPAQQQEFFHRLSQLKSGGTGPAIQALAAEFGVTISHESANNVRKGPLADYLRELRAKSERAQQVAAFAKEGLSMADAASVRLSETVFDELMQGGRAEELTAEERDIYSKIIARARAGDERARLGDQREKFLEAKMADMQQRLDLLQFDATTAAVKHAKEIRAVLSDKKLGDGERTDRIRRILFGAQPADFRPVSAGQPEEPQT